MFHTNDTIAAIATHAGPAARAVVRISGPDTVSIVERCFRGIPPVSLSGIHLATVVPGVVIVPTDSIGDVPADVYVWPGAHSYTRQPAAEMHTLGSPVLATAVLQTLCAAGARLAEPGEFTLRAFLAGRIDLTQAEAVLGVINARGTQPFQTALAQLAGGLARPLHEAREALLNLVASLEAGLDFAEEDIEFISAAQIEADLAGVLETIDRSIEQLAGRGRNDALARVALMGWPNVGKSSLFNAISGTGQALVSTQAGTTRDYLTVVIDLDGVRCQLSDTAGIEAESAPGEIGGIAQSLSGNEAQSSDIRVLCIDATRPLSAWERMELATGPSVNRRVVLTKCDLPRQVVVACPAIETSAASGRGIAELRDAIRQAVLTLDASQSAADMTWERSAEGLRTTRESVLLADQLNRSGGCEELVAAEIRVALDELGKVVGAVYTDDILDRIFSRFCIGK